MKIAIMQPYFLPYMGYFALMKNTKHMILFDSVQFIKHGWIERNRILKPSDGWQYIRVPLMKYSRDTCIKEITINGCSDWRDTIFRQLEHYKLRAPFYTETVDVLRSALNIETESIVKLDKHALQVICDYISVDVEIEIFSEMGLDVKRANAPDEWALNICHAVGGVDEYWNPEGGLEFFNREKYEKAGINIRFFKVNLPIYSQRRPDFYAGLSIIDVMMYNDPMKINAMMEDYSLL